MLHAGQAAKRQNKKPDEEINSTVKTSQCRSVTSQQENTNTKTLST